MKKRLLAFLTTLTVLLSLSVTALAAVGPDDVAKIGDEGYPTLQAALDAADEGDVIELLKNVNTTSSLGATNGKAFTITSGENGPFTITAVDESDSVLFDYTTTGDRTVISVKNGTKVTFGDITLNGGGIVRGIYSTGTDSKVTIDGTTITNCSPNRMSTFENRSIGGVYISGAASFEMKAGTITGNDPGEGAVGGEVYASDLWIGANATGVISGGTIGNVFVNANEYSQSSTPGSFTVDGGAIQNVLVAVYVDGDDFYGSSFTFESGAVDTLYLATEYGVDLASYVTIEEPVAGGVYRTGTFHVTVTPNEVTITEGKITDSLKAEVTGGDGLTLSYEWFAVTADGSKLIDGATSAEFVIPTNLGAGVYSYYCVVRSTNDHVATTGTATVTVTAAETPSNPGSVTPGNPGSEAPETGDESTALFVLSTILLGAALIVLAKKKARR